MLKVMTCERDDRSRVIDKNAFNTPIMQIVRLV